MMDKPPPVLFFVMFEGDIHRKTWGSPHNGSMKSYLSNVGGGKNLPNLGGDVNYVAFFSLPKIVENCDTHVEEHPG